jgi:hypothetical protein
LLLIVRAGICQRRIDANASAKAGSNADTALAVRHAVYSTANVPPA